MKLFKATLFVAAAALFSFATADLFTYNVDGAHSRLGFTIKHMGVSDFNGQFDKFETKFTATKADFSDAKVEFTADAASINTYIDKRDEHLRSEDFLNTAKYPEITFKSTSFKKAKGNNYDLEGDFTFHGVTKKIKLNAELVGSVENPQSKKTVTGFKVTGVIKRSDYGIATGFPVQMLGDDINVTANLELVKE